MADDEGSEFEQRGCGVQYQRQQRDLCPLRARLCF